MDKVVASIKEIVEKLSIRLRRTDATNISQDSVEFRSEIVGVGDRPKPRKWSRRIPADKEHLNSPTRCWVGLEIRRPHNPGERRRADHITDVAGIRGRH